MVHLGGFVRHSLLAFGLVVLAVVAGVGSVAEAKQGGRARALPTGAGLELWASSPGGGSRASVPCVVVDEWVPAVDGPRQPLPEGDPGTWVRIACNGQSVSVARWYRVGGGVPAQFVEAMLVMAADELFVPAPTGSMNPDPSTLTVHWPTWLWVDPVEFSEVRIDVGLTTSAGQTLARGRAIATPELLRWDMGNGEWAFCDNWGSPPPPRWQPGDRLPPCGHTYTSTSAEAPGTWFQVTPHSDWLIDARCTLGCSQVWPAWRLTRTGEAVGVRVGEIQAIVTG